jgi:hypothetical protein
MDKRQIGLHEIKFFVHKRYYQQIKKEICRMGQYLQIFFFILGD